MSESSQWGATRNDGEQAQRDGFTLLAQAIDDARIQSVMERDRLRRRLWWWRFGGIALLLLMALGAIFGRADPYRAPHIALVEVKGMITDDPKRDALFEALGENDAVAGVIIRIDSPGGTATGGEALYASIRQLAEKKPVASTTGESATSAAYIAAMATDYIVARGNSLTGSVGVLLQLPNFGGALEKVGVKVTTFRSGALKAAPSMFEETDPAADALAQDLVEESFQWFIGLVEERRELAPGALATISDGRVLTGRMALQMGLIDAIGGRGEAVRWLETERGVAADLPVRLHSVSQPKSLLAKLIETIFGGSKALARIGDGPRLWAISE